MKEGPSNGPLAGTSGEAQFPFGGLIFFLVVVFASLSVDRQRTVERSRLCGAFRKSGEVHLLLQLLQQFFGTRDIRPVLEQSSISAAQAAALAVRGRRRLPPRATC